MSSSTFTMTRGRALMTTANLFYAIVAFIADWNETHVKNPRWPPHARFHNGQTMSLGVCLATASIYFALRKRSDLVWTKESLLASAVIGSFYCFAGLSAILYPGTAWVDPEFDMQFRQYWPFGGVIMVQWMGYFWEMSRLNHAKSA